MRPLPPDLPALTEEELRDIGSRNRNPDVRDLLWEIARLRQRVRYAHYMAELLDARNPVVQGMVANWLAGLTEEPCVVEAAEADYGSEMPGTRGWRGEARTPEHEQALGRMVAGAKARIAKRRFR